MKTPIIEEILKLKSKKPLSFHTPGHKNGLLIPSALKNFWPQEIWSFDLTEIGKLDNLHFPKGCIQEAQQLTAKLFGAKESYFLVNGTTVGIQAAIMALCHKEEIFVPRNAHKSIYNAAIIADADVVSLPISFDKEWDIPLGVEPETLEKYIANFPNCKTIILPNPNYQGVSYKTVENIGIAKRAGLKIILDEAHGAHFFLDKNLPTGLKLGADMVIQSWHKTLPTLTQASVLHISKEYLGPCISSYLNILQSTSPSYLLLASLDATRAFLEEQGKYLYQVTKEKIGAFKEEIEKITTIKIVTEKNQPQDPLRLCISSSQLSGFELDEILREKHGIFVEMATEKYILMVFGLATSEEELVQVKNALREIATATRNQPMREKKLQQEHFHSSHKKVMAIQKAFYSKKQSISINESQGRISGDFIIKYPPGIPWLIPGEVLTAEIINFLKHHSRDTLYLKVIKEN